MFLLSGWLSERRVRGIVRQLGRFVNILVAWWLGEETFASTCEWVSGMVERGRYVCRSVGWLGEGDLITNL